MILYPRFKAALLTELEIYYALRTVTSPQAADKENEPETQPQLAN